MRILLIVGAMLLSSLSWADTNEKSMTVQEVNAAINNPAFEATLLDVRTPEEYAEGHIEGSMNIPVDSLKDYVADLSTMDRRGLVVYCRSGRRAARAISMLKEAGFNNVIHMEGDMTAWNEAGLPIIKND